MHAMHIKIGKVHARGEGRKWQLLKLEKLLNCRFQNHVAEDALLCKT